MAKTTKSDSERPTEPRALLFRLQALFPMFGRDELAKEVEAGERGLHGIMLEFSGEFRADEASEVQLDGLTRLVEQAVAVDDQLENAVSTCFLEALGRGHRFYRRLSREAKGHAMPPTADQRAKPGASKRRHTKRAAREPPS